MRLSILFFLTLGLSSMVMSQEDTLYLEDVEPTIVRLIEGGLSMSTPAAEFSEKVNSNLLWGFSGAYLRQIRLEQPAFIGLEFYHAHIGSVRRTYSVILTDETIDVEGKMSSNIAGINLLGRYYSNLRLGPVEPFLEMHFGVRSLYTYLSEAGTFFDEEPYSNFEIEEIDWTVSYGGAIGLQTHVGDGWYVMVKGSYEATNSTSYLRPIEDDPTIFALLPRDGFEIVKSPTNMFRFDVGFAYIY